MCSSVLTVVTEIATAHPEKEQESHEAERVDGLLERQLGCLGTLVIWCAQGVLLEAEDGHDGLRGR